ncbi:hypothetical protein [Mesomycoplasma lagogenitalium]|uniref:Uncharacterized protein n=1 Tax=Mesomycoplasma lagogenitalium TaxID=171286 RepID=A0ABY8LTD7_9BACT|nr:hypothetical protein [Mesomycoplasma lagogenitalium]WGI36509.1 hypothetical protein QEG99_03525 [Mesomycoplasma lagogenitalium]
MENKLLIRIKESLANFDCSEEEITLALSKMTLNGNYEMLFQTALKIIFAYRFEKGMGDLNLCY